MACLNPDGTITESAKAILGELAEPHTAEEISRRLGQPLFRVRSALRELAEGGLIRNQEERFFLTDFGKERRSQFL